MADSPGSSLSSHASSEFADDIKPSDERESSLEPLPEQDDTHLMPPSKRQRTGQHSFRSSPAPFDQPDQQDTEDLGDISSDTSGSIPASPSGDRWAQPGDEEYTNPEQVTSCKWLACAAGDLGNMDNLVRHIHVDHIGNRQKRYACEWEGCVRAGLNHASGYALRAHMRSHTREKPFFCALPGKALPSFKDYVSIAY